MTASLRDAPAPPVARPPLLRRAAARAGALFFGLQGRLATLRFPSAGSSLISGRSLRVSLLTPRQLAWSSPRTPRASMPSPFLETIASSLRRRAGGPSYGTMSVRRPLPLRGIAPPLQTPRRRSLLPMLAGLLQAPDPGLLSRRLVSPPGSPPTACLTCSSRPSPASSLSLVCFSLFSSSSSAGSPSARVPALAGLSRLSRVCVLSVRLPLASSRLSARPPPRALRLRFLGCPLLGLHCCLALPAASSCASASTAVHLSCPAFGRCRSSPASSLVPTNADCHTPRHLSPWRRCMNSLSFCASLTTDRGW